MSDYLQRRDQLLMQDEEIAELKAELVELREVYRCAKGLCAGEDWNGGTAAFYYRKPLRKAVVKAGLQEKGE